MPSFVYIVPTKVIEDGGIGPDIPPNTPCCATYSDDGLTALIRTTVAITTGTRSQRSTLGEIMRETEAYGLSPRDVVDHWRVGGE